MAGMYFNFTVRHPVARNSFVASLVPRIKGLRFSVSRATDNSVRIESDLRGRGPDINLYLPSEGDSIVRAMTGKPPDLLGLTDNEYDYMLLLFDFIEIVRSVVEPTEIFGGPINADLPLLHFKDSSWFVRPKCSLDEIARDWVSDATISRLAGQADSPFTLDSSDSTFFFGAKAPVSSQEVLLTEDPVTGVLLPQPRDLGDWRGLSMDDKHGFRRFCWVLESGLDEISRYFGEPDARLGPIVASDSDKANYEAEDVQEIHVYEGIHENAVVFFRLFGSGRVSVSFGLRRK
jgi:hypothetical protein